mmetsp:Transcript_5532/g.8212  ORF Transcript_5532/g.8212 Transcript_5532/m.8212 type:complete len:125 (-) Transcript_5532:825-1199(-)
MDTLKVLGLLSADKDGICNSTAYNHSDRCDRNSVLGMTTTRSSNTSLLAPGSNCIKQLSTKRTVIASGFSESIVKAKAINRSSFTFCRSGHSNTNFSIPEFIQWFQMNKFRYPTARSSVDSGMG